ncbi:MAG: GTP-binding protein [Thermoleophilia bacterium]
MTPRKHPVTLLTGFLGSGKTTLLRRLLEHPGMGETAVIVNELGEVPLDHHLVRAVDERTVVLASGCVCCTMRGDLAEELRDLFSRRIRYEIPDFHRVVVETTGLADPAPVLYTLLTEPVVRHHFELECVVTTVDSVNGLDQLERQPESVKQAAVADRLVVTKADIAAPEDVEALEGRLRTINPAAALLRVEFGDVDPAILLRAADRDPRELDLEPPAHTGHVHAFSIELDEEVDWTAFGVWLTMLLQSRGQDVLRVKGLVNTGGDGPLVLNGVQHVIHPPEHLPAWPDADRRSRLVFIARGVSREEVERSLRAFNRAAALV